MTGAVVPEQADTVLMQERVRDGDSIRLAANTNVQPGKFVHQPGSDIPAGHTVLQQGKLLSATDLGVLASQPSV